MFQSTSYSSPLARMANRAATSIAARFAIGSSVTDHAWYGQAANPIDKLLSDRINIARVIAIIGMLFVHIPPGLPKWNLVIPLQYLFAEGIHTDLHTWFGLLKSMIIEGIGRTSACLLSIVAGYLAARSMAARSMATSTSGGQYSHRRQVAKRFRSLYLPMVFWSSLTLVLFAGMSVLVRPTFVDAGLDAANSPLLYLLNIVFFITDSPHGATIQLAFLRDIFVCALLLPWIVVAIRKAALPFLLILAGLYLTDTSTWIILRPLIILCFSLGVFLAFKRVNLTNWDSHITLWGLLFLLSTMMLVALKQDALDVFGVPMSSSLVQVTQDRLLYPASRLTGAIFLWSLTARLATTRAGSFLLTLTPLLFVAYCSHVLVLGVIYTLAWQPLFGGSSANAYPIWFFSAPVIAMLASFAMLYVSRRLLPGVYRLISGSMDLQRNPQRAYSRTYKSPGTP